MGKKIKSKKHGRLSGVRETHVLWLCVFVVFVLLLAVWFNFFARLSIWDVSLNSVMTARAIASGEDVNGGMLYDSLRFRGRHISYTLIGCSDEQIVNMERAFLIIENYSVLNFERNDSVPQITVSCLDENLSALGEGGPDSLIDLGFTKVILNGSIFLHRSESCSQPVIGLHELLHVLGFVHRNITGSIMYPQMSCDVNIDLDILGRLNSIYSEDIPEVFLIVNSSLNRGFVDLEIKVFNLGRSSLDGVLLIAYSNGDELFSYSLGNLEFGDSRIVYVENLRLREGNDIVVSIGENSVSLSV